MQPLIAERAAVSFNEGITLEALEAADAAALDLLEFGVVRMDQAGVVVDYNAFESQIAGLSSAKVIGRHFFTAVAPCTNNFMVAERFETEAELDDVIDYVFTLRMRPTKVRLRLLKAPTHSHMYLLVERK
jgi:photoactive yellow protein